MHTLGSGFAGLCMAIKLKKAGIRFRVLEKQPDLGGAWHCNQYPGARCDITSCLYQYSFYMKPDWSAWMAQAKEIKEYLHVRLTAPYPSNPVMNVAFRMLRTTSTCTKTSRSTSA